MSVIFRFFTYVPTLPPQELDRLTQVDYRTRMALIATTGAPPSEHIIAVGRYERLAPQSVEVALAVADAWQQHGLGMALLQLLAAYARAQGYTALVAYVMEENCRMLDVFANAGYPLKIAHRDNEITVTLDITLPPVGPAAAIQFTVDSQQSTRQGARAYDRHPKRWIHETIQQSPGSTGTKSVDVVSRQTHQAQAGDLEVAEHDGRLHD